MLQTTNNIQSVLRDADSVHQKETHSGCLPVMSDDVHFMEAPKVENCETPPRSHQSSTVPDATRYVNSIPFPTTSRLMEE